MPSRRRPESSAPDAPLHRLRPAVTVAALYAVAVVAVLASGGGRWIAVHLFTLGILTNLVVALTVHFAETVLHAPARGGRTARLVLLNAGVLAMLPREPPLVFATGATVVAAAVTWLYLDLRGMRRATLSHRFAFVVRAYERAAGAFLHGAALGVLAGLGVLGGAWWGTARLAHLHLGVLGWGGLTLLATVVFFGPTMMRTRIRDGADGRAGRWLRHGMTGLTAGALLLLASAVGGTAGLALRVAAAAGLGVYALAATAIATDVLQAGRRAKPSLAAWSITASCTWFVVAVWADVAVVATGAWRFLGALGAALLAGVLGQAILAALNYLTPMMSTGGPEARGVVRAGVEFAGVVRFAALNTGVALVIAGAVATGGAWPGYALRAGWALVAATAGAQVAITATAFVRARGGQSAR